MSSEEYFQGDLDFANDYVDWLINSTNKNSNYEYGECQRQSPFLLDKIK